MLDFDASKLRALVIRDYVLMAEGITDAAEMNRFTEAVMSTAVRAVRDELHAFNQQSVAAQLPAKVLAACFQHLPYLFCIHPSHVCRSWRAAAIAEPRLWLRMLPWLPLNRPELLHMALSRTGTLPVDLKVDARPPTDPEAVYAAITPFSRDLRYLAWSGETPTISWDFPAPNMEGFCCYHTMTITSRFLGGHVGRLRCLYLQCVYLPFECPVLSTVTELSVRLTPSNNVAPSTLVNVFELFPRLEWFQVLGITSTASDMLPSGPAPTSLKELVLNSMSLNYDLMPHYLAWGAGNLRHVSLSQYPSISPNLAPLVSGTVRLAVKHAIEHLNTSFMFEHSGTVSHSVFLWKLGSSEGAALLADVQMCLANVHTVLISHTALEPFCGIPGGLPALERLVVHIALKTQMAAIYPEYHPHPFDWSPLQCLSDLARAPPTLRSITLQVWCDRRPAFVNADNARGLISQLRSVGSGLPPIEIQGFPAEEVSSVDLTGLNVRFDVLAKVGDLVLRKDREIYYPFGYEW